MSDKSNLTGGQTEDVLDTLLYDSLREIVENTDLFDVQLIYLLSLITSNKKRKPYNAETRERAISLVIKTLTTPRDMRMQYLVEVKMERNFIYIFLENVLNKYYRTYVDLYRLFISTTDSDKRKIYAKRLDAIVTATGASSRSKLFVALVRLNDMLPLFKDYFHSVVADFYRLCQKHAKFYIDTNKGKQYDSKDVNQNFLRNVLIAINKYDSAKGAIVSYVKWWILNAQTCSSSDHEYGIAYIIPQTQKKRLATKEDTSSVNFSVSLDTNPNDSDEGSEGADSSLHFRVGGDNLEDSVNGTRQAEKLGLLVKRVDPFGIARLTMDIREAFEKEELDFMRSYMRRQDLS